MVRIYVLFGGLFSTDGVATSAGMHSLVSRLKELPDTYVTWHLWHTWRTVADSIARTRRGDKVVVIGYSGGGWRATSVANAIPKSQQIDLMVLYDPSPSWGMEAIGHQAKEAVCYHNLQKMFIPFVGWIGGGVLLGANVTTININMQHLAVQFSKKLHDLTVAHVKALSA